MPAAEHEELHEGCDRVWAAIIGREECLQFDQYTKLFNAQNLLHN